MTETTDVIVIGGGVSGLAAARELARAHFRVTVLEARGRMGGRIDTRRPRGWPRPVEVGAEFIHGGNPGLWRLVQRARLRVRKLQERHWLVGNGAAREVSDLGRRLAAVTGLITPRKAGRDSFAAFFRRHPAIVAPEDWMMACGFVQGFEAAPLDEISARALAEETLDERHQYALPGGYDQVIAALVAEGARLKVRMRTGARVRSVRWRRSRVEVAVAGSRGRGGKTYAARAVVVTLPLGVWQARSGPGVVRFYPPLKQKQAWADRMRMGQVVRLAVRFERRFWRRLWPGLLRTKRREGLGFIHSQAREVPVWWSLSDQPVLVGWAGGPAAKALLKLSVAARRRRALRSLAATLGIPVPLLKKGVAGWQGHDWSRDPFSRGAYSFTRAGEDETSRKLRRPVQGTLFFAGEATAEGAAVGTVHGALASGLRAAAEIRRKR